MTNLIPKQDTRDENLWFGILFMVLLLVKLFVLTTAHNPRPLEETPQSFSCQPVVLAPAATWGSEPTAEQGQPAAWTLGGATGLLQLACEEETSHIRDLARFALRHEQELSSFWR